MNDIIKLIDKIKGHILAVTGGLYGLGLICWMYYSWQHNLGHIDAFEAQYFVTGIFPALLILFLLWLISGFSKLSQKIVSWLESNKNILNLIGYLTSLFLLLFIINIFIHLTFLNYFVIHFRLLPFWLQVIIVFVFLNVLLLIYPALLKNLQKPDLNENKKKTLKQLWLDAWIEIKWLYLKSFKFLFWAYLLLTVLVLGVEYVENFYPNLPQELGGVKPKKVILITDPFAFSKADQVAIFPDTDLIKSNQTDTLLIYFYNGDKIIFKSSKEVLSKGRKAQTFELSRSEVKSIKWIN